MKIGMVSLGCPKNLVDSEVMLGIIKDKQLEITNDPADAELIIVNTCGVIESAKEESRISISTRSSATNTSRKLFFPKAWKKSAWRRFTAATTSKKWCCPLR